MGSRMVWVLGWCSADKVGDVPVVQVVVGVSWKVPQIQFIARVCGPSSLRLPAWCGGDEGFFLAFLGHFSRSSRSYAPMAVMVGMVAELRVTLLRNAWLDSVCMFCVCSWVVWTSCPQFLRDGELGS